MQLVSEENSFIMYVLHTHTHTHARAHKHLQVIVQAVKKRVKMKSNFILRLVFSVILLPSFLPPSSLQKRILSNSLHSRP